MKQLILLSTFFVASYTFSMEQTPPSLDEDSENESTYLTNQKIANYFALKIPTTVTHTELLQLTDPSKIDLFIKPRGKKLRHLASEVIWYLDQFCNPNKIVIATKLFGGFEEDKSYGRVPKHNVDGSVRGYVYQDRSFYITQKLDELLRAELEHINKKLSQEK